MFKYALLFLLVSIVAGAVGLTNVSKLTRTLSMVLFGLFFLGFLLLIGLAMLVDQAVSTP